MAAALACGTLATRRFRPAGALILDLEPDARDSREQARPSSFVA
jgi:hypothetical protein